MNLVFPILLITPSLLKIIQPSVPLFLTIARILPYPLLLGRFLSLKSFLGNIVSQKLPGPILLQNRFNYLPPTPNNRPLAGPSVTHKYSPLVTQHTHTRHFSIAFQRVTGGPHH